IHADWMKTRLQDYGPGILDATESGLFIPAVHYIDAQRMRGRLLKHWLEEVFSKVDVLMTPVVGVPTPTLAESAPASGTDAIGAGWGRFTWPFAYLGVPALAVPVGFQHDGMP